jgi:SAM-dependent methyltransferase
VLGLVGASHSGGKGDKKDGDDEKITCQIIYVPTQHPVVIKMLEMAKVTKDDVLYDLGCGDGRIVALAVGSDYYDSKDGKDVKHSSPFRAKRGVGVDIDPDRMKDSKATLEKNGFSQIKAESDGRGIKKLTGVLKTKDREAPVEFRRGDALKVKDLQDATVILLYMLPEFMQKLEPQARKLRPGTRIVAHDYDFRNWKADEVVEFRGPDRTHTLYMWEVKK